MLHISSYHLIAIVCSCSEVLNFTFKARIKKIMQTDEEIGKVAAAVPVIICIHF